MANNVSRLSSRPVTETWLEPLVVMVQLLTDADIIRTRACVRTCVCARACVHVRVCIISSLHSVRFGQLFRCAHERIVNIMKVYIERNNMQVEFPTIP